MQPHIIEVADGFWNIRGSFKIGRIIEIGTHASLIRRSNGGFVFLDSYALSGEVERRVLELTNGGKDVEAILNIHPFHTVYARKMHQRFPDARHYGTARHLARFSELRWEAQQTEDPDLHAMFADDFDFSVPRGVDFISSNENVHFASVLVLHQASKSIHVDDTLMYIRFPKAARLLGRTDLLTFHPTLGKALQKRDGAAQEFREWAEGLAERWCDANNLCAAHTATLTAVNNRGTSIHDRMLDALTKANRTLKAHESKHG